MRRTRWLLAGLLVLAAGWTLAPHGAPPVYDGIGFPDEPYRFVTHVDGSKATKAPTTAIGSAPVSNGVAGAISMNTAEQAPQVSVLIPVGRLHAPAGTRRVVLHGTPEAMTTPPPGGHFWSNVYRIDASTPGVTLADGQPPATITLRAATAQRPRPAIERYANGTWTKLTTAPLGRDIYQARLPGLGSYAVVGSVPLDLTGGSSSSTSDGTSITGILIAVAAGVVLIVLIAVAIVRRRRRPIA